MKKIGKKIGYA